MRSILATIITVATVGGCGNGTTPSPQEFEWETSLQGNPGWEHLSGQATVVWVAGVQEFFTSMQITGDLPGAVRPWHVHHNTCEAGGGIVGGDGDYPRLNIAADGSASVSTTVPVGLNSTAAYHVNVHLSEAEVETIIACGNLTVGTPGQNPPPPGDLPDY
jgi:superoxide dismutase, Cu-Zn family